MGQLMTVPPNLIEQIETIRDYDISYDTLHTKAIINDKQTGRRIKVPFSAFSNKYKDALSSIIITEEMDPIKKKEFWYKPKSVSLFYYETTELWADILTLNGCVSIREFTPDVLKIYDPTELKKILNEIMILEDVY